MTRPAGAPRETWDEAMARGLAKFYASGGWTSQRRARLRPFIAAVEASSTTARRTVRVAA